MNISYNGLCISITVPAIIAIFTFLKWLIARRDKNTKNKNVHKTPSGQA